MTRRVTRGAFNRWCRRCGWKATYDTAGKADYAKRRHSCERWTALAERNARGEQIRSATDRTPRECHHKIARHVHGTYACYTLDACRCFPCAAAVREYEQNRVRQQAYGRWDNYVDAAPAREHIRSLMARGMGLKRIVAVSDISQGLLWKLVYGKAKPDGTRTPSKRVRKDTLERILAIELDLADGAMIDGTSTTRRIQALVAQGWSQSKLAERLGINRANFTPLAQGTRDVTVATAKAVYALYRELVDQAPPEHTHRDRIAASRARNYARAAGWTPALRINGKAWIGRPLDLPEHQEAS